MREFQVANGMALSVWNNKYSRRKPDGAFQTWAERLANVVGGNFALDPRMSSASNQSWHDAYREYERTLRLAKAGVMPFSGRHLQHGGDGQADRRLELHANCATSFTSFMSFLLSLRGAGVGRDYSAATCRVDWSNLPDVRLVLDDSHADFDPARFRGAMEPLREARHKYDSESERVRWFEVADSREGWAKIVEILETAAFHEKHRDKLFIFDFSQVRPNGSPIAGLQGRPASGPLPLMDAIASLASLKAAGMRPWKQALFTDHYLAACVVMGGARRTARMATKDWRDRDVIEFIDIKRGGFLWSANNSILVDAEFWEGARSPRHSHARRVFEAAVNAAYFDGTGEPGFINVDKLTSNLDGADEIDGYNCVNPKTYVDLHPRTQDMMDNILSHIKKLRYRFIVNPCSEIVLALQGALCVIADICLAEVKTLDEALDAAELTAKYLIRTNRMQSDYAAEVARTNRIGVSLTGIHEFAWTHFGLTFRDMIDYGYLCSNKEAGQGAGNMRWLRENHKAHVFWMHIESMRIRAETAAREFAIELGMTPPHTVCCLKPSGTVSKVMSCTEGAHLPASPYYLRWVQYKIDSAELADLEARGYPVDDISRRYPDHMAVGFPTRLRIADLMGDEAITADEASPEEQFRWLMLLERFWIGPDKGNQVSYTLKYDARDVSYTEFMDLILEWQPKVRCCAVMPSSDWRETKKVYGYVPEQPLTRKEYDSLVAGIRNPVATEAYDDAALACESGACPIEPDLNAS